MGTPSDPQTRCDRLAAAMARRDHLRGEGTTLFRAVDRAPEGLDDAVVDWLDGVAVVSCYRPLSPGEEQALLDDVESALSPSALFIKRRPKEAHHLSAEEKRQLAPREPVRGGCPEALVGLEEGLRYRLRPGEGLGFGLYLDARSIRTHLRRRVGGRRLLNLFAYTCGFGVAALAGGAAEAVNVDLSRRVLDWGEENRALNGQDASRFTVRAGEAMGELRRLTKRGERFGAIVLDPPAFATAGRRRFRVANDYPELVARACAVAEPGALLLCCCNQGSLGPERFERLVRQGIQRGERELEALERMGPSTLDFPNSRGLKVLALTVS